MHSIRLLPLSVFALAVLGLVGCDYNDDGDDNFLDDSDAVYVDFSFDRDNYQLSENGLIASFESSDIESSAERNAVEDALLGANDGALVLLYADGELVFENGAGTWTALPITVAYEATDTGGVPYVDYTVTYSYSYDDGDLYFDVLSSAALDFDTVLPQEVFCRLVVAPADALLGKTGLDYTNYEAVRRAFNLPD